MDNTKEHPIILTAQEVNAVLAGNKTQHRVPFDFEFIKDVNVPIVQKVADETDCTLSELVTGAYNDSVYDFVCPFGKVGDRLWVQEFHASLSYNCRFTKPHYYADGPLTLDTRHDAGLLTKYAAVNMPRWASRILLEITDIRIERVQDITHNDSVREAAFTFYPKQAVPPLSAFPRYWMEKHGDDAWRLNPWVWVIEFKVVELSEGSNVN